jgi:hypothetical protein
MTSRRDDEDDSERHICLERGCTYSSPRRSDIASHLRSHSDARPFACAEGCGFDTKWPRSLRNHEALCRALKRGAEGEPGDQPFPKRGRKSGHDALTQLTRRFLARCASGAEVDLREARAELDLPSKRRLYDVCSVLVEAGVLARAGRYGVRMLKPTAETTTTTTTTTTIAAPDSAANQ